MAEAPFIATPLADLDTQRSFARSSYDESGIFTPVSLKFAFVTVLLWGSMLTLCALSWVGAFTIGVRFVEWMR